MTRSPTLRVSRSGRNGWPTGSPPPMRRGRGGKPAGRSTAMVKALKLYVRYVDALNAAVGKFAMYLFFALAAVLLYSVFSRLFLRLPVNWSLEMSQFLLSAYYLLGGAYSLQMGSHVRMDLFYGAMSPRRRAFTDA